MEIGRNTASQVLWQSAKKLLHSTCGNRQNTASQYLWQSAKHRFTAPVVTGRNTASLALSSQYLWQLAETLLHSNCGNQQKRCFTNSPPKSERRAPFTAMTGLPLPSKFTACRQTEQNPPIFYFCLLYTSPSPRDSLRSRMPSSA